ncbi:metal-dependent hydrolase [Natrarchaeobius halalkaliphilus]|uniref:Metal-dependent hydrolase n=1 Tax=Natrarchaeobius halalkaliphilus TaxID=1679091 RepID=A0A3N6LK85_9EURY|nr:metal-dependent hydrolase [Natrarchaeobius halalkaliphilus]RQG88998.1 metal-dependent hydrolase [Natrarchaeobius halalkaliphilus]
MMATTHVFAGLAAVAPVALVVPEFAGPLALGAVVGAIAPDFDLVLEHRRTLHFPVAGLVIATPLAAVALVATATFTVALAAVAFTAWLHAASDALGGGPEMDPWNDRTERAVYDHVRGRWIEPRRVVRYDGAPEDAILALSLAAPVLVIFDGWVTAVVAVGVPITVVYALLRRRLTAWTPDWLE